MDFATKALYGGIIPSALVLALAGAALWRARRHPCRRLAAWSAPLAAGIGVAISFVMQFSGSVTEAWHRLIWVAPAVLVIWTAGLMLRAHSRASIVLFTTAVAVVASLVAGLLIWPAILPQSPQWLHALPFATTAIMVGALFPLAQHDPQPTDGIAVGIAGAMLAPTVVFSGQGKFGELLVCAAVAAGVAAVLALFVRGDRCKCFRQGSSAGAAGVALLLPIWAAVTWSYGADLDLTAAHAWALALAAMSPLLLLVRTIPPLARRPLIAGTVAVILVSAAALIGFLIVASRTDVAAYDYGV